MDTPRIKITHAVGEFYPNEKKDFEWVWSHRPELFAKYGACVLLVYEQQVVGTGKTLQEAMENAEQALPDDINSITPVIEFLSRTRSALSVRLKSDNK